MSLNNKFIFHDAVAQVSKECFFLNMSYPWCVKVFGKVQTKVSLNISLLAKLCAYEYVLYFLSFY